MSWLRERWRSWPENRERDRLGRRSKAEGRKRWPEKR